MKIKNILALLCFLCIGVSCSMEDDILNNVDMGGVGTNIANTEAVFAFSLSGNSSMTKAGEITENPNDVTSTESSISNCFVAIIKMTMYCLLIGTQQAICRRVASPLLRISSAT